VLLVVFTVFIFIMHLFIDVLVKSDFWHIGSCDPVGHFKSAYDGKKAIMVLSY